MQAGWLQWEFYILTGLFIPVVLRKNSKKTVGIVCQSCHISGLHSNKAYKLHIIGEGTTYQDRQRQRFWCPDCVADLTTGSQVTRQQTQDFISRRVYWENPPPPHPVKGKSKVNFLTLKN